MKRLLSIFILFSLCSLTFAQPADTLKTFWHITNRNSIIWYTENSPYLPHSDNLEMDGRKTAAIIYYSINKNKFLSLKRRIIFPQMITFTKTYQPWWKKYRAYLQFIFSSTLDPIIIANKHQLLAPVDSIEFNGTLIFYHKPTNNLKLTRILYPDMYQPMFVELWKIQNTSDSSLSLRILPSTLSKQFAGLYGLYKIQLLNLLKPKTFTLAPHQTISLPLYFLAFENNNTFTPNFKIALAQRDSLIKFVKHNFILQTPDKIINTLFFFSKLRAAESLYYSSKMGLINSPGGGNYYVGIWANDQAQYSAPFYPLLGYKPGITAAKNCYLWFQKHRPKNFNKQITSSFEMNATLTCCGIDRGDAAMIAYGLSQFLLLNGNPSLAKKLWPLLTWTLEYNHRHKNKFGVVTSQSDEMEGRLPTGSANLSTSSLYYGALIYSYYLAKALNKNDTAKIFLSRAKKLKTDINNYFGANINGLQTYRYFKGNSKLRHWICMPLVVGIFNRKQGTINALFNKLWTPNGILVQLDSNTRKHPVFWDRATLYAFIGAFKAGAQNLAVKRLEQFSKIRLLGPHVPYVVEAYPENNMKQLSAESALYTQIFVFGLLGLVPTSFSSFKITPHIPQKWNFFNIINMHLFNSLVSFFIKHTKNNYLHITIFKNNSKIFDKTIPQNKTIYIKL